MAEIKLLLRDFNPWWKENFVVDFRDRIVFKQIQKFLPLPQIIALTGLRRVGKTTLMLKIVDDFIGSGFNAMNIVYFAFDEFKEIEIRSVLKEYEELMEKNLREEKFLFLFDEIQKLSNWENQLKTIYDLFGKNAKIIISGSESLFIKKKSRETLAGRIFEFKLEQLSFKEFLDFKGIKFEPIGLYEMELKKLFNEFVFTLGFPELVDVREKDIIKKYVKESVVEKIVFKDIPKLFKIKNISIIESLLNIFLDNPGQLIEIGGLAKELGVSRQTVSNYLHYLEESFLIKKLYNFSRNRRKIERKLKKFYPTILSVDLLFAEDGFSKSKVFEWLLVNQLNAEFFWRDAYKNEVDMVFVNKKIIPIEIKFGRIESRGLLAFMKKFSINEGLIVSFDKEEKLIIDGKTISIVPAFKFLLNMEKFFADH